MISLKLWTHFLQVYADTIPKAFYGVYITGYRDQVGILFLWHRKEFLLQLNKHYIKKNLFIRKRRKEFINWGNKTWCIFSQGLFLILYLSPDCVVTFPYFYWIMAAAFTQLIAVHPVTCVPSASFVFWKLFVFSSPLSSQALPSECQRAFPQPVSGRHLL